MSAPTNEKKDEGKDEKKWGKNGIKIKLMTWIKDHIGITLIMLFFIAWRLYFMTRNHDIIWDEAVYLGIGKYLWSLGHSGLWEIIRPLGLPAMLGFIWKIGLDSIFWGELLAVAFSTGCLYLTYLIGSKMHSKLTGVIASTILAMTPTFFLYSGYIMTDIPSTFFMLAAIFMFVRNRFGMSGLMASLAFMFRYPHGLIMASIGITLVIYYFINRSNKNKSNLIESSLIFSNLGKCTGAFAIIPTTYMIINWFLYHTETSKAWHAIFRPWILAAWHAGNPAEAAGGYFYYIQGIFGENILLWLSILALIWYFAGKEYKDPATTLTWITLAMYLIYFSSIVNKQLRFGIAFLPLLAVFSAKGMVQTADWIAFDPKRITTLRTLGTLITLGYLFLFVYPEDMKYYGWRFSQPQPIVSEVYQYFERSGKHESMDDIQKPILTTDPLPAAYSSKRFEPFYFSVDSSGQIYDQHINESWGVLFVPEAFYCAPGDTTCKDGLALLQKKIMKDNELVIEKRYGREDLGFRTYQIWKRKIKITA